MKAITFKQGSWHHRLACFGGLWRDDTDLCAYTRRVLWGLCKLLWWAFWILVACVCVDDFLGWVSSGIAYGFMEPRLPAILTAAMLGFACVIGAFELCLVGWEEYGHVITGKLPSSDAFVSEAWRSFKDKVCFRVEVK